MQRKLNQKNNQETEPAKLLEMRKAGFHAGGKDILSGLDWTLRQGENWAVMGPNGSGKSTFLRLVRGEIWPGQGMGQRTYFINGQPQKSPNGFKENTGLVSSDLLDRYKKTGWDLNVLQTVCTGFYDSPLLHQDPSPEQIKRASEILSWFGLDKLSQRSILAISRGQAKRVLIARAMVNKPRILLLDECCEGLDRPSCETVLDLVQELAQSGTTIIYATHRREELVPAINHSLTLKNGRIVSQGSREDSSPDSWALKENLKAGEAGRYYDPAKHDNAGARLIEVRNSDVFRDGKKVLSGIDWQIQSGQNWAILGENGAGKTSLAKLLTGDLLPAEGGQISWFEYSSWPGISELRTRIGLVSAEFQARHGYRQNGLETILSGFQGSIGLSAEPSQDQKEQARQWVERLGLDELAERDVASLSYGQLRKLLIARAMVNNPDLLVLDEPLAGLDSEARDEVLELVEQLCASGAGIVFITHHWDELPPCITHLAILAKQKFAYRGPKNDYVETVPVGTPKTTPPENAPVLQG